MIERPLAHLARDPVLAPWVPAVALVPGVLGAAACDALIARATAIGLAPAPVAFASGERVDPRIRDNDRALFDDPALAAAIFPRVAAAAPPGAVAVGARFRVYRYRPGQRFAPHTDGAVAAADGSRSALTLLVYLDDGCEGGETAFVHWGVAVAPRRGAALLFDHLALHESRPIVRGEKHVLRSDLFYR